MADDGPKLPDSSKKALLAALAKGFAPAPQAKPSAFLEAADVYITFAESASRLMRYARITLEALEDYKVRGIDHFKAPADDSTESLMKLVGMVNRKMDVDFLKEEKDHADALVFGQAIISVWSALEVFVNDILLAVLLADPARLESIPSKVKMSVADFYAFDDDRRIEHVFELVKQETRASLSPGVGAFEPTLEVFGLKGPTEDLTRRELLEFSAVRHCLVHRKGIVDARFLKACGTTKLKLGEQIRVTSKHAERYFYAASQYAATILDRVKKHYEPALDFRSSAHWFLEQLKKLPPAE